MKRLISCILLLTLLLPGCGKTQQTHCDIAASTWPVYQFCTALCEGTDLQVERVITDSVSCLHNYTLSVSQMKIIERCDVLVLSGAGLEDFMADAFASVPLTIDAAKDVELLASEEGGNDPHIWLSPSCAKQMVLTITEDLSTRYPDFSQTFEDNCTKLCAQLDELQQYGDETLASLSTRELVTFHDGFAYFAQAFDLTILAAIEEESGSEASAAELREIISLVQEHGLPAVFTEVNGSDAAASVIASETGCAVYSLSLIMGDDDYFSAMRQNINTIKEALG